MHLVIWCLTGLSLIIPAGSGSLLSYKTKWRRCRLRLFSRHHEGCPGMAAPSAASMPAKKPCPPPSPAPLRVVSALGLISLASGAPHFFPEVRVTLCAVQQRCPAAERSGARECISCILVTSHSRLPGHRASSSVFEKTLVKKKGLLFSWQLQMKNLFTWELRVIFMEMWRALAIFIVVTEAIESIFYWYVFTCPQKSYCVVFERILFRFSILK